MRASFMKILGKEVRIVSRAAGVREAGQARTSGPTLARLRPGSVRWRLERRAAPRAFSAHLGLTRCHGGAGAGVRQKIFAGEFMAARLGLFEIGSQFLSTQARALLQGDVMLLE